MLTAEVLGEKRKEIPTLDQVRGWKNTGRIEIWLVQYAQPWLQDAVKGRNM